MTDIRRLDPPTETAHSHRLTGGWRLQSIALDAPLDALSEGGWIDIPDCGHLQPLLYPERPYWGAHLREMNHKAWVYRQLITAPDVPYRRARLRFDAVDYFAQIWLNDHYIGEHEGNFAPFTFDVTEYLRRGADNVLTVRVTSPWDEPNPRGMYPSDHVIRGLVKGLYEHGEGVIPPDVNPIGIWRPVSLLLDGGVNVDGVRIRTALDGQVDLAIRVSNATGAVWRGQLAIEISAETHDGAGVTFQRTLALSAGMHVVSETLTIPDPRLWWSWDHGAPDLYRLRIALCDGGGQVIDTRDEVFGVRTVRLERAPDHFTYFINERPVSIRGASYIPALYLSQCSAADFSRDIALAREANLNLLRVHVHVSPPELYDLCDRAGMLIWQDFELNWIHDASPAFEGRARAIQREMIDMLANHPSIITWACHNEPTMVYTRRHNLEAHPDPALYADAVAYDPTRPVFLCSGQAEDDWRRAGDSHWYYGAIWSPRFTDVYRHWTRLNTEFGFETPASADTLRLYEDVWERLKHIEPEIDRLWAYQAALIKFHVEHFRRLRAQGCAGYIQFWLTDLVPQVGCGALDSQRIPKGGYDALRIASQPLHVALEHDGRRPIALWVFNDTVEAYAGVVVRWRVESPDRLVLEEGETAFDVAANRSQRVMAVNWRVSPAECARVHLSLHSARGELLCENAYDQPFNPPRRPRGYPWKFDPYLGTKVFDKPGAPSLTAKSGDSSAAKIVPLPVREWAAERLLRTRLPSKLLNAIALVLDRVMT